MRGEHRPLIVGAGPVGLGTLSTAGVHFAGDAAHVHSPVGARGMNLGLEDAWVFSRLVRANRLADYDRLRRPVDRRVVRRVEFVSRITAAETWFPRLLRRCMLPPVIRTPFVRRQMCRTITGLDHDLPRFDDDVD